MKFDDSVIHRCCDEYDRAPGSGYDNACSSRMEGALSSITISDLMHDDKIKNLVNASETVIEAFKGVDESTYEAHILNQLYQALAPFKDIK